MQCLLVLAFLVLDQRPIGGLCEAGVACSQRYACTAPGAADALCGPAHFAVAAPTTLVARAALDWHAVCALAA